VGIVDGIPPKKPLYVNFDVEVSGDGNTLYFVIGRFGLVRRVPKSSDIHVAVKADGGFRLHERDGEIMERVNTDALEYAAAISTDGLELFFTRLDKVPLFSPPDIGIYTARRDRAGGPFGRPKKIEAIEGFAEAPSLSPDGRTLYYHKKTAGGFNIYRVSR
jgi:Tol biopolymer transport system component